MTDKVLFFSATETDIDNMMKLNQIKNPHCKLKAKVELLSEYILADEKQAAKLKVGESLLFQSL